LRRFPNIHVRTANELLIVHGMNVMTDISQHGCEPDREVLAQLDLHRMCGIAGTGKSSSAEAAANAIAA
jgi:hypothetical protein